MLPARWCCDSCNVNMANECAKEAVPYHPESQKICPICFKPLRSLGIANSIKPFWYRIPKFFSYPAKLNALLYIGVLSLGILISFINPIVAVIVYIFAFFGILKYACKCLSHAARGNLSPPDVWGKSGDDFANISLKQFALFIFIMMVIGYAFRINALLGYGAAVFSLLSVPATTMLLAMTGSFFSAINPAKAIRIMFGMGKSYFILYLFLLLMSAGDRLLEYWASTVISPYILLPFLFFITAYFTVAMFSMMGYAIYQYHEQFDFNEVVEVNLAAEGIDVKASGVSPDSFLNEIHILVSEGLLEEAIRRLKKQLKRPPQNMIYHDKYQTLLKLAHDAQGMAAHTTDYIKLLLKEPKVNNGKLISLYMDCLKLNPGYFYPDAQTTLDLAKSAQEFFRNNDALALLNRFAKNYPDNELIPYAYFLAAQLLVDHKQQERQAKKVLLSLLDTYPGHKLTAQIKDYLGLIEKIQA